MYSLCLSHSFLLPSLHRFILSSSVEHSYQSHTITSFMLQNKCLELRRVRERKNLIKLRNLKAFTEFKFMCEDFTITTSLKINWLEENPLNAFSTLLLCFFLNVPTVFTRTWINLIYFLDSANIWAKTTQLTWGKSERLNGSIMVNVVNISIPQWDDDVVDSMMSATTTFTLNIQS